MFANCCRMNPLQQKQAKSDSSTLTLLLCHHAAMPGYAQQCQMSMMSQAPHNSQLIFLCCACLILQTGRRMQQTHVLW